MSAAQSKRILILEDEVLLAIEAAESIQEMGGIVIGPVHRIEAALQLLDKQRPDAALLDVNIHGHESTLVAERLRQAGIPFILTTGYGAQNKIAGSSAVIDKPYNRQQLQAALAGLFEPEGNESPAMPRP